MIRILSIDPGTYHTGIAVYELNEYLEIENLKSWTYNIDPNIDLEIRMDIIYEYHKELFKEYQPYHLAHEAAFINRFRPQAYGPIYTSIFLIRKAFRETIGSPMFSYPPKYVKSVISTGDADKHDMLEAIRKSEVNKFLAGYEDEHSIDAIAIGLTHILELRNMPELLLIKE